MMPEPLSLRDEIAARLRPMLNRYPDGTLRVSSGQREPEDVLADAALSVTREHVERLQEQIHDGEITTIQAYHRLVALLGEASATPEPLSEEQLRPMREAYKRRYPDPLPSHDQEPPYGPGAICEDCGHWAGRHDSDGCHCDDLIEKGIISEPCPRPAMLWNGERWADPSLPSHDQEQP